MLRGLAYKILSLEAKDSMDELDVIKGFYRRSLSFLSLHLLLHEKTILLTPGGHNKVLS